MSLIGRHTLNPTSDPAVLATRASCTAEGHQPVTFNPWHDATWCRCGELVTAGNHGVTPAPRLITPRGKHDTRPHRRYVRVIDGDLTDWVGIAEAPLEHFARGVVAGRQVEAEQTCASDCYCQV